MTVRKPLDKYYTPEPLANSLVRWHCQRYAHRSFRTVLEPSSGGGAFLRALRQFIPYAHLTGIDLEPTPEAVKTCHWHIAGDFMQFTPDRHFDLVIGNPPFSHAEEHVRHAMKCVDKGGHVAFLLRLAFMESQQRAAFWETHRARDVLVLRKRPSFTGGSTDSCAYGFFVFEKGYQGAMHVHPCWAGDE